jgi:uridylate kinase
VKDSRRTADGYGDTPEAIVYPGPSLEPDGEMMRPRYQRVLLKLSGEALLGNQAFGIDNRVLSRVAGEIGDAVKLGIKVAVVVGGGNIFRGIAIASAGGNRVVGDQMGMLATVMNAVALASELTRLGVPCDLFSGIPVPTVCETFTQQRVSAAFAAGRVLVLAGGTGNPFFTTDSGAALRAAELGCDALFKGTSVDGVYSADPKRDKSAVRFDKISHADVLAKGLAVMDAAAVALARDNHIPVVVFSILQSGAFVDILNGKGRATVVSDD